MPRARLKSRNRRGWTQEHEAVLICGHDLFHAFADNGPWKVATRERPDYTYHHAIVERRRQCWEDLGERLLREFVAKHPFQRPAAWWEFDAPERRQCVNRQHPLDNPERIAYVARMELEYPGNIEALGRLFVGIPSCMCGPDFDLDPKPEYESERDYLIRTDLLTDYERQLLANQTPVTISAAENSR